MYMAAVWKLLGVWCLLMLLWPVALLWIRPDFSSGNFGAVAIKSGVVLGVAAGASLLFTYLRSRHWSRTLLRSSVEDVVHVAWRF